MQGFLKRAYKSATHITLDVREFWSDPRKNTGNPVTEADTFKAISFTTSAMQAVKTIAEIIRVHREIHPENHQLVLSVVCTAGYHRSATAVIIAAFTCYCSYLLPTHWGLAAEETWHVPQCIWDNPECKQFLLNARREFGPQEAKTDCKSSFEISLARIREESVMVLEIDDDDDDKPQSSRKRHSQPQRQDPAKMPKMITPTPLLGKSGQSPRHPWQDPAQPALEEHDHTKVGQSSDCQAKASLQQLAPDIVEMLDNLNPPLDSVSRAGLLGLFQYSEEGKKAARDFSFQGMQQLYHATWRSPSAICKKHVTEKWENLRNGETSWR